MRFTVLVVAWAGLGSPATPSAVRFPGALLVGIVGLNDGNLFFVVFSFVVLR